MTREMGPVLTAICVAGFVGGGIASLIATMRVNEEIDALEVMSINPVSYLIMPRLAAMMLVVPASTDPFSSVISTVLRGDSSSM